MQRKKDGRLLEILPNPLFARPFSKIDTSPFLDKVWVFSIAMAVLSDNTIKQCF